MIDGKIKKEEETGLPPPKWLIGERRANLVQTRLERSETGSGYWIGEVEKGVKVKEREELGKES